MIAAATPQAPRMVRLSVFVKHLSLSILRSGFTLGDVALMNMQMILARPPAPDAMDKLDFLADGSVALTQQRGTLEFSFQSCGLRFSATTRLIETGPVLQIASDIAPDPYSAEGASMRAAAHAVIEASHGSPACRLMISRQRRIFCVGRARLDPTFTPTSLLTSAVELVLEARPYLTVLRDILPNWQRAIA